MSFNAEGNFNVEKFARDVIVHQLEFVGCDTSKIGWRYLPENRYRWHDYIETVSRTVTVLRLSRREKYVEWFSDFYSDNKVLQEFSLKSALNEITDSQMKDSQNNSNLNIGSFHTMFLLALFAEASLVCYLKEKYELINAMAKWWQESYEKDLLVHLTPEGGLDVIKRWGDHIAYIDLEIPSEYVKSIYLPDNKYNFVESDLAFMVGGARWNFIPDLDNVHIYADGTLRFLDIMPLTPIRRAKLNCIKSAKVKTENSDLLVRLGVIRVKPRDTLSIYRVT